jgi:hypothetical protein
VAVPGALGPPAVAPALDLVALPIFMDFTGGPVSPFFLYVVLSLLGTTLGWRYRGALRTPVAMPAACIGMSVHAAVVLRAPDVEPNTFIIGSCA